MAGPRICAYSKCPNELDPRQRPEAKCCSRICKDRRYKEENDIVLKVVRGASAAQRRSSVRKRGLQVSLVAAMEDVVALLRDHTDYDLHTCQDLAAQHVRRIASSTTRAEFDRRRTA